MNRVRAYWKTIACAGVIIYLSLIREYHLPIDITFAWRDKLFHALAYCVLGLLFGLELHKDAVVGIKYRLLLLSLPVALGGIIELLQEYLIAPRIGEWADFAANTIGVLTAYVICTIFVMK